MTSALRVGTILLGAATLLLAACSSSATTSTWTFMPPQPTGSPGPSSAASPAPVSPGGSPNASGGAGQTITLEETSSLTITQNGQAVSNLVVHPGETITFQVTNSAGFPHDFYIGTPDQLTNNQTSGLPGIDQFSSGTQTFTYTVTADTANLQFGCSLPGHYQTMHGTFTVQP